MPSNNFSAVTAGLEALSTALKIAREATDDVPIVKQIVGSAVHIVDVAQKMKKNSDAVRSLAEQSAILAQSIRQISHSDGCAVEGEVLACLERLNGVFKDVEDFITAEAAVTSKFRRAYRNLVVVPQHADDLRTKMDAELRTLLIAASIDTNARVTGSRQYDGEFRRLRDSDVRNLGVLSRQENDNAVVTFLAAEVDGKAMVVRYLKKVVASQGETESADSWHDYDTLLREISTVPHSHTNVAQFYGASGSGPAPRFVAIRGGGLDADEYLLNVVRPHGAVHAHKPLEIICKLLDAAYHLKHHLHLAWVPPRQSSLSMAMDDQGAPTIGLYSDIGRESRWQEDTWATAHQIYLVLVAAGLQQYVRNVGIVDESCCDGQLKDVLCAAQVCRGDGRLADIWAKLLNKTLRVERWVTTIPGGAPRISKSILLRARQHWVEIVSARRKADGERSWSFQSEWFMQWILNDCLPEEPTDERLVKRWSCWYRARPGGLDMLNVERNFQASDLSRKYESYRIRLPVDVAQSVRAILRIDERTKGDIFVSEF